MLQGFPRWTDATTNRIARAVVSAALLLSSASSALAAQEVGEISPACGDYHPNVIIVDGMVRKPTTLTVAQLGALPDQQNLEISFLDRLNNTQTHTERGPLLWTVLSLAAGGVEVSKLVEEQYQGPNPYVTLYVILVAVNGYQSLVSEAEIDPAYGNGQVLLSITEDGVAMTQAPYATTNKAPASWWCLVTGAGADTPIGSAASWSATARSVPILPRCRTTGTERRRRGHPPIWQAGRPVLRLRASSAASVRSIPPGASSPSPPPTTSTRLSLLVSFSTAARFHGRISEERWCRSRALLPLTPRRMAGEPPYSSGPEA
jgi:hypothetical protein